MRWFLSNRQDPEARVLADRHYSRQNPGAPGFVPPGRCIVLKVPGKVIRAGKPCRLSVSHVSGGPVSWFMVKDYTDNLAREGLAADALPPGVLSSPVK